MIGSPSAGKAAPRAAFVAALEFAVRSAYDETRPVAAPAPAGSAGAGPTAARLFEQSGLRSLLPADRTGRLSLVHGGRLGEIVAICSVAAVLAGTAARGGPHVSAISTPTLAAATDTATPVGAVATPVVSARP